MSERTTLRPKEKWGIQLGPTLFRLEVGDSIYVSVMQHQYIDPTIILQMGKIEVKYAHTNKNASSVTDSENFQM